MNALATYITFAGAVGIAAPAIQAQQFVQMGAAPPGLFGGIGMQLRAIGDDGEIAGTVSGTPSTWTVDIGYSQMLLLAPMHGAGVISIDALGRYYGVAYDGSRDLPVVWYDRTQVPAVLDGFPANWTASGASCNIDGTVVAGRMKHTQTSQNGIYIWREGKGVEVITQLPPGFAAISVGAPSDDGKIAFGGGRNASASSFQAVLWIEGMGITVVGCPPGAPLDCSLYGTSWDGNTSARDAVPPGGVWRVPAYWNVLRGWTYLGTLQGHNAGGVTTFGDPWVTVGATTFAPGNLDQTAVLWNPLDGMRPIKEILEVDYGLDLTGWQLFSVGAMSRSGRYIAGYGFNPLGLTDAWWAEIIPFCYADCDRDKQLTFFDFLCYVNHFDLEDIYSNCNNDGAVDFFDFLCFINKWHEGCQ